MLCLILTERRVPKGDNAVSRRRRIQREGVIDQVIDHFCLTGIFVFFQLALAAFNLVKIYGSSKIFLHTVLF